MANDACDGQVANDACDGQVANDACDGQVANDGQVAKDACDGQVALFTLHTNAHTYHNGLSPTCTQTHTPTLVAVCFSMWSSSTCDWSVLICQYSKQQ